MVKSKGCWCSLTRTLVVTALCRPKRKVASERRDGNRIDIQPEWRAVRAGSSHHSLMKKTRNRSERLRLASVFPSVTNGVVGFKMETVREENKKKRQREDNEACLARFRIGPLPDKNRLLYLPSFFFFLIRKEIKHFFEFSLCSFGQTIT